MDKCPRCGEPVVFAGGQFLCFPDVSLKTRVKLFVVWVNIGIKATLMYCPKCGFSAIQNISVI